MLRRGPLVEGKAWSTFVEDFRIQWRPGQHMALIGTTGCGKSTFASGILSHRKYLLALDPKGGDEVLETLKYERLVEWPPSPKVFDKMAEGEPARFIVGNIAHTAADYARLRLLLRDVLDGVFELGGWTVYVDEFQLLADHKMMNLATGVETLLVAARSKGVSVVTSYQAPAWVPKAASRQSTWIVLWPTQDQSTVKILAESIGRDWRTLWAAMEALPEFHCLVIGRNPRAPMIVTSAPRRK